MLWISQLEVLKLGGKLMADLTKLAEAVTALATAVAAVDAKVTALKAQVAASAADQPGVDDATAKVQAAATTLTAAAQ